MNIQFAVLFILPFCLSSFAVGASWADEAPRSFLVSTYSAEMHTKGICGRYEWMEIDSVTTDTQGVTTKKIERRWVVDTASKAEVPLYEMPFQGGSRTFLLSAAMNSAGYRLVLSQVEGLFGPETLYYITVAPRADGGVLSSALVEKGLCIAPGSTIKAEK